MRSVQSALIAPSHNVVVSIEALFRRRRITAGTTTGTPESTQRSDEDHNPGPAPIARIETPPVSQPRIVSRPPIPRWTGDQAATSLSVSSNSTVNLRHMEFLLHYKFSMAIPELDTTLDQAATNFLNKLALQFPWLHVMLAISARHLTVLKPNYANLYLAEAFQLQNEAITLFNSERLHIDETNCSAALLFSSILGRHMLVDTLAGLESDGSVRLDDYCHYVQVHRGLRTIASDAWRLLPGLEIWPFLVFSGIQRPRNGRGSQLDHLRSWVRESPGPRRRSPRSLPRSRRSSAFWARRFPGHKQKM